jgi:predicted nucleic acid-binding protein
VNGPKRYLVDTNVILRFLTGDPPHQAAAARKLFARARAGEVELDISPVIVAEAIYTMLSYYRADRREAALKLTHLLEQRGVRLRERDIVLHALSRLETVNVAFADAYLAAEAAEAKAAVASFDKDFDKFAGITRYEPAT